MKVTSSLTCNVGTVVFGSLVNVVLVPKEDVVNVGIVVNERGSPFKSES